MQSKPLPKSSVSSTVRQAAANKFLSAEKETLKGLAEEGYSFSKLLAYRRKINAIHKILLGKN
ncbi:MAG: hypothetical protein PHQ98_04255 [Candidatus ainarchaeum sp.]|nr:hypothetical protein [Candidatus ainarchaeum sp.]